MKKWLLSLVLVSILVLCIILIYVMYPIENANNNVLKKPMESKLPHIKDQADENTNEAADSAAHIPHKTGQSNESDGVDQTDQSADQAASLQAHIDQLINSLTLQQKIGQLLIIGIEDKGTIVSNATEKLIVEQGIGNIILFKRNIKSDTQLAALIQQLKSLSADHMPPLMVSIDQEGGRVNRLPTQYPSAEELTLLNEPAITKQVGEEMGISLSELSIDMNYAPVLDINSNPNNPIIGSRAFGADADTVVLQSLAMLEGLDDYVLTVGKHFPGHGDTNVDSHYSLPTIDKNWEELEQLELIPFRAAIEHGIDAIMIGHLFLPQIDDQYPASLSPTIINDYLRKVLHYNGVIMTDDLVMGGITNDYDIGDAAVLALQAGNTMLIIGHEPKQQQKVLQTLYDAVSQNRLDETLIDRAVELVLRMKLGHVSESLPPITP